MDIIEQLSIALKEGTPEDTEVIISSLNLDAIEDPTTSEFEETTDLFMSLIPSVMERTRDRLVVGKQLLDHWEKGFTSSVSYLTYLLSLDEVQIPNNVIYFCAEASSIDKEGIITPLDLIYPMIRLSDGDRTLVVIYRVLTIFKDQINPEDLEAFLEESRLNNNIFGNIALQPSLTDILPAAPKPDWVNNEGYNPLPTDAYLHTLLPSVLDPVPLPDLSNKEIASLLVSGIEQEGFVVGTSETSDIQKETARMIEELPGDEQRALQRAVQMDLHQLDLREHRNLVRILGPVNPMETIEEDSENPCYKYGGCRMFTCTHYVEDELFDPDFGLMNEKPLSEREIDFSHCSYCFRPISHYWNSVRRPEIGGGWAEVYCSFEHMEKSGKVPNQSSALLNFHFQKVLREIGIQNRVESPQE